MNPITLGKTIAQSYFLMTKRAKSFGEPVRWTDTEAQQFLHTLPLNPLMQNRFAIAANNKNHGVIYHYNLDKYIAYKTEFTVDTYYRLVHLDYLEDYLKWGEMVYQYAHKMRSFLEPMKQCFRITIPLKLKDGHYHWVLMEAYTLQLDKDGNLISHLNIYTILSRFEAKEKIPLVGDMWDNNKLQEDWTHDIWKKYNTYRSFVLTHEQTRIVDLLKENLNLTNAEIATALVKTKNTIDVHNKQILSRARDAFNIDFKTIKELVQFLQEREQFPDRIFGNDE